MTAPDSQEDSFQPPKYFQDFVEMRREEIAVERSQQDVQKLEIEKAHEYAMKALETQFADRERTFTLLGADRKRTHYLLFAAFFVSIIFVSIALATGNKDIVGKTIELAVIAGGGFGGGYAYATHKAKDNLESQ